MKPTLIDGEEFRLALPCSRRAEPPEDMVAFTSFYRRIHVYRNPDGTPPENLAELVAAERYQTWELYGPQAVGLNPFSVDHTTEIMGRAFVFSLMQNPRMVFGKLAEIDRINWTAAGKGVCASHDFCDANMDMSAAWKVVKGFQMNPNSDVEARIWSRTWAWVKTRGFQRIEAVLLDG